MTVEILGVDIAKNVFQLHGVNRNGRVILKRRVMRDQLMYSGRRSLYRSICTAACQPHIPFVPKKTATQQDIQALHRARQRMVNHRTAVVSQIRGLLLDRGFAIAKSITRARRAIPEIISDLERTN